MKKQRQSCFESVQIVVRNGLVYRFAKRSFDIVASALALVALLPLMLFITVVLHFTVKGPVIYVDARVGKNGKLIRFFKFRTMHVDANVNVQKYLNAKQMKQFEQERKVTNDPRVTKFGKFLRNSSLDELPQLVNVLRGDMSVIGPRAVTWQELTDNYTPQQVNALLTVRPGLSGMWCVYGRYGATYRNGKRQRLELQYLSKRNVLLDVKLIALTVYCIVARKDAQG